MLSAELHQTNDARKMQIKTFGVKIIHERIALNGCRESRVSTVSKQLSTLTERERRAINNFARHFSFVGVVVRFLFKVEGTADNNKDARRASN